MVAVLEVMVRGVIGTMLLVIGTVAMFSHLHNMPNPI